MPELARFFGIIIRMFAEVQTQHHYPHLHAYYGEHVVVYRVDVIEVVKGGLPKRQQRFVEAWIELHQEELMEAWQKLQQGELPAKIAPLQ